MRKQRVKVTDEMEKLVISEYIKHQNTELVAKEHNICSETVLCILKRNNIRYLKRGEHGATPKDLEKEIIQEYKVNKRIKPISEKYNLSNVTIINILKRNGIAPPMRGETCRKYSCDFGYFNKINTQEKAYFLGLICSDGNNCRGTLSIGVHKNDYFILEEFKKSIKADNPVKISKNKSRGKDSWIAKISIYSYEVTKDLEKYGVVPNKTGKMDWKLIYDNLPKGLIRHFIRGFFDGDGCAGITRKTGAVRFNIVEKGGFIITGIRDFFKQNGLTSTANVIFCNNIHSYSVSQKEGLYSIYDLMYRNATVFLPRKKDRFDAYLFNHSKSVNRYISDSLGTQAV